MVPQDAALFLASEHDSAGLCVLEKLPLSQT